MRIIVFCILGCVLLGMSSCDSYPEENLEVEDVFIQENISEENILEEVLLEAKNVTVKIQQEKINLTEGKVEIRKYNWYYLGKKYTLRFPFYTDTYQLYRARDRGRDYDLFVTDSYDDVYIEEIAKQFKDLAYGDLLDEWQVPILAISFIQSLPYTSDNATTGYDEFPRYPYETLYDNGGDCEDSSILGAAILRELDYEVALIALPGHIALGVKCDKSYSGYSYEYDGKRFCYLETTGEGWNLGEIPEEFEGISAQIWPIIERPFLQIEFNANYTYDSFDIYVDVDVEVKNLGSMVAEDVEIYTALQTVNEGIVWDQISSNSFDLDAEDTYFYRVSNLHAPSGEDFRIEIAAIGNQTAPNVLYSEWITWE